MKDNMVLILIDECGDELEYARYTAPDFDGDEDAMDIWKERKIERALAEYPEAQGAYMEDRRTWSSIIARSLHEWF